jgi:hypothetical protein
MEQDSLFTQTPSQQELGARFLHAPVEAHYPSRLRRMAITSRTMWTRKRIP